MFLGRVDRHVAETILEHLRASDAPMRVAQLRALGGAIARVPSDATAFAHRNCRIMANIAAFYTGEEDRSLRQSWVTSFANSLRQGDERAYVNFLNNEGPARVRAAYPASTWQRLAAIKARYDPDNCFHATENVPPQR